MTSPSVGALQPGEPARLLDPTARTWLRRSTVQTRLTAAFCILGLLSLGATLLAIWQLMQLQQSAAAGQSPAELKVQAEGAARALLVLFVVLTAISIPLVVALLVNILKPMHVAVRIARKVADGDLTVKVRTGGNDELARLMLALDDMTRNLRRIVGQVMQGAGTVAATAGQVRQSHGDLSQRTEHQASTLEETASSMEQLTATVAQNAQNASQASALASGAAQVAAQGGDVVGRVVGSMAAISESARKIADISSVIDGIAFQTNLLALNAAVEAARAGEQGRGFAVVAAEVRNLAQRCATAAREIKSLIGESAQRVDEGRKLADAAGSTMQDIVSSIGQVSALVREIAAASGEQKAGIEQVNAAIAQMDAVVQQNASLVEHTGTSTEHLYAQSAELLRAVAQFRLEEGSPAPIRTLPAAAPATRGAAAARPQLPSHRSAA